MKVEYTLSKGLKEETMKYAFNLGAGTAELKSVFMFYCQLFKELSVFKSSDDVKIFSASSSNLGVKKY